MQNYERRRRRRKVRRMKTPFKIEKKNLPMEQGWCGEGSGYFSIRGWKKEMESQG